MTRRLVRELLVQIVVPEDLEDTWVTNRIFDKLCEEIATVKLVSSSAPRSSTDEEAMSLGEYDENAYTADGGERDDRLRTTD